MWFISKSENAVFMKQKGSIVGKVWDIAAANNKGCIKIMMNGLDKIMRLEDFHAEDNEYSSLFAGHLSSRHSFVERWRTFKKSGQNKSTSTVKRTYSKINPFEFKDDAASDKLDDVTTQKKVHVEVHRPSISDCSEVGDISPLTAEPVGVCEDDLSGRIVLFLLENESSSISSEETHTENANKSLVEAIQKKLKGYMVLPVSKLRQPSFINLLREPDLKHVKELEREFKERPGNYFQLMVVNVCGQLEVDNFESCTLEVIGGNHSREALQNIISETPNPSQFEKRMCIVYTNLNPDEAKYVANQHNQVRKFGTDLDLVDRAGCFRYALFEKAGYSNLQDTIGKKTPTNKEIIHKWKEGLQLCMGAVSRKTLNNRFRFEMKLAQLQTEVWVEFLEFKKKLKKEVKKDKISGRLLKPLNGVSSENMLKFLNDYNSEKINFRQLTSLCNESKSNEANKKDESSECEPGTSAMNSEVETFVEPLDDEVEEEEATNDIKLVEELKRTAAREKKRSDELQLKNEELKEALETSNRERDEMKKELSQRLLVEKKMHDEIRQLKEKLNQATKECRILREKQGKLTKRKITAVDATEEVNIPVTKKPSTDNWNFKEGPEDLEIGMVVAITPIRQRDVVDGEPWLAITNDVSKARIKVSWLKGSYTTNWIPNPDFEGCAPDSIPRNRVACSFKLIHDKILPGYIVDKLKKIFKN
ncbi:uncharacterized protein LOC133173171 [Saccostrea echinata]|uniref:uncharacterized protein LOC133173171 n=1 Tax=Saccostrea echinata TaxID=191078 RepID=UPI002A80BB46|nr:uncharacterized protein LOC133173171 [Saccostrea echinata]